MKEKIKSYLNQSTAKQALPIEYTFKKRIRKTLGSEEENEEKIVWNTSAQNLTHFYSPPKGKVEFYDVEGLIAENKRLKEEVRTLKELLVDGGSLSKTYQKLDLTMKPRKDEKAEQIAKLKKIIEKSYYSIKQMQSELARLNEQLSQSAHTNKTLEKRSKILQFQKQELEHKIANNALIHRQEIEVLHERIRKLDLLTEQLVDMVEQDQRNWLSHMHELTNLKKFYSGRTYK